MQSLTTVVKVVGKSVAKKEEIRAYIKACSKIGCSLKQIFAEFLRFTDLLMCLMTWFLDGKKIDSGLESIENAPTQIREAKVCML